MSTRILFVFFFGNFTFTLILNTLDILLSRAYIRNCFSFTKIAPQLISMQCVRLIVAYCRWNWIHFQFNLPIIGAKRHEFPINGSSFGPGISVYGRARAKSLSLRISVDDTSFGEIFIADENAVRLASEWAAVRIPMLISNKIVFVAAVVNFFLLCFCPKIYVCCLSNRLLDGHCRTKSSDERIGRKMRKKQNETI